MHLKVWAATDVGILRDHNEDNHLVNNDVGLAIVADGMGGHAAGELASSIAVRVVDEQVVKGLEELRREREAEEDGAANGRPKTLIMGAAMTLEESASHVPVNTARVVRSHVEELLANAVRRASGAILDAVDQNPDKAGMGTTVSTVLFHDDTLYYAHVGDSRVYRFRDEEVTQVSEDHSLVQEQIRAGILSEEEAKRSRFKNIITRSVGFDRNIEVDTGALEVRPGDRFLLCSDGLSNLVRDSELLEIVTRHPPETCLKFCINLANSRGGDDNITAVLAEVCEDA